MGVAVHFGVPTRGWTELVSEFAPDHMAKRKGWASICCSCLCCVLCNTHAKDTGLGQRPPAGLLQLGTMEGGLRVPIEEERRHSELILRCRACLSIELAVNSPSSRK